MVNLTWWKVVASPASRSVWARRPPSVQPQCIARWRRESKEMGRLIDDLLVLFHRATSSTCSQPSSCPVKQCSASTSTSSSPASTTLSASPSRQVSWCCEDVWHREGESGLLELASNPRCLAGRRDQSNISKPGTVLQNALSILFCM